MRLMALGGGTRMCGEQAGRVLLALSIAMIALWSLVAPPARSATPRIATFETSSERIEAGSHGDLHTTFTFTAEDGQMPDGAGRHAVLNVPPGVIGNPMAYPRCPRSSVTPSGTTTLQNCPRASQVGIAEIALDQNPPGTGGSTWAVLNVDPGPDFAGRLVLASPSAPTVTIDVTARTEGDYGLVATTKEINNQLFPREVAVTLWGVPGAHTRGGFESCGFFGCFQVDPRGPLLPDAPETRKAFVTMPTVCDAPKRTTLDVSFFDLLDRNVLYADSAESWDPTPTECENVPFDPSLELRPSAAEPGVSSGLEVNLSLPHDDVPGGRGTSHLRRAAVVLPDGLTVNPSAADGLVGCSDAEFGYGSRQAARCPEASKIGTVRFDVPVLDRPVDGVMYLGEPLSSDPESDKMFRIWQYADTFGLKIKIRGHATADPRTGRITGIFDGLPQVPITRALLRFKGGARGLMVTPQACGRHVSRSSLLGWAGKEAVVDSAFATVGAGGDGACVPRGFAPTFDAGTRNPVAGAWSKFAVTIARGGRDQEFETIDSVALPEGLLGAVGAVPLCQADRAASGTCGAESKVGHVQVAAGAGSQPVWIPQPGKAATGVYLAGPYEGAPYSLSVVVPAQAGPYDLGRVVVRSAIHVDPLTAKVTAKTDTLPTILGGIPLNVREIRLMIDRERFTINPTSCAEKQISGVLGSLQGARANVQARFQVGDCRALRFKPKLSLRLTGQRQVTTGKHPGVRARVVQASGSAGIDRAKVILPKSLALDPDNAQALCEFEDGTKPDLENHCPKGSIIGKATAVSPLLNRPLSGNVYFVKNVRTDPKTGNLIRTLPMLMVALRGEIAINLKGQSATTKAGKLVNTFAGVPDAPVSRFDLKVDGGRNGILAVTRTRTAKINICNAKQTALAYMDGQNGRRYDRAIAIKRPCIAKKTKTKAKAKRR